MTDREFHYVITVQYQNPDGPGILGSTRSGVCGPEPGDTRESMYDAIVSRTAEELGITSCVTLFFSLEPNDVGASDG